MTSNLLEHSVEDIMKNVFNSDPSEVLVVNPSGSTLETIVDIASSTGLSTHIRLLGDDATLKGVMDDFLIASHAADLIENGTLEIRNFENNGPENSLIITPDVVFALIEIGDRVAGLNSDDRSFVDLAYRAYRDRWDGADPFTLRTPPLSEVKATLEEDIGEVAADDFNNVLGSLQTARGDGEGLDEVTISILIAAKNNILLYDISKWGEDVGIASKATFSRTKTKLEDMGIIDTEKVPIDVGRPRLRLKFGDDRLRDADTDQLASVAQGILN